VQVVFQWNKIRLWRHVISESKRFAPLLTYHEDLQPPTHSGAIFNYYVDHH